LVKFPERMIAHNLDQLLQAYDQVGDADAVVTAQMDRRWQLVLGCHARLFGRQLGRVTPSEWIFACDP
jgi:hypothetical protein